MANTSKIDIEIAFTYGLLAAVSLSLYSLYALRDRIINSNRRLSKKKIHEIDLLSGSIFLICLIYFEITSLEDYQKEKTSEKENYVIANSLSLSAQFIRLSTLYAFPSIDEPVEDVL